MSKSTCLVLLFTLILSACSSPKRQVSLEELSDKKEEYVQQYDQELEKINQKNKRRLKEESIKKAYFDVLVLSGGGELGAFGAGFLKGWGKISSGDFQRPEFDSVSGISTGALIAPFAFIGTDRSYNQIVDLYSNTKSDLISPKPLVNFLFGQSAYYNTSNLHQSISTSITPALIEQLSANAKKNKTLLVGATNLDYGTMRVWDLADIALVKDPITAKNNIVERLVASSAIPSVFPPVIINNSLYVDGGASMQIVSGLEDRSWLKDNDDNWDLSNTVKVRVWVIVNNKLKLDTALVQNSWTDIAARSLISLMRSSTLQVLQDFDSLTQMINQKERFSVEFRYVAIPQSYQIPETKDLFDQQKMRDLIKLGIEMGENPNSWKTRVIRPGAAILDE